MAVFLSACPGGPRIRECIISVEAQELYDLIQTSPDLLQDVDRAEFYEILKNYVVADCVDHDGRFTERSLQQLDAHFAVDAADRETLLLWARARCQRE